MSNKGLQNRGKANKDARREALREELQSREYLRQIHGILDKKHAEAMEIQESKMKLDGYFKLLAKTLPDVKSVELTGNEGGPLQFENISDAELERAIRDIAAEAGISIAVGGSEQAQERE